jgi:pimeloyl-ACP methyl ester carboxylesterase
MMITHDYADVNGVRLHYAADGLDKAGKLVLFLHGFPEFWYAWKDQLAAFGQDYRAVAPDLRGYNLSSRPQEVTAYRMSSLVEDIRALAAHLGHGGNERFVLVGHDWGGAVAWAFALAHPEMLEKLVIVNAPHPAIFARELRQNPAQQEASRYMLAFRAPDAERVLSADGYAALLKALTGWGIHRAFLTGEDRRAYVEAWSQPGALTGGLNYYRVSRLPPPEEGEAAENTAAEAGPALDPAAMVVRVPTLVIWGEQDRALLTGNLEGLDRFVPDLRVRRVPDASHWVVHEQPELVESAIREFIA